MEYSLKMGHTADSSTNHHTFGKEFRAELLRKGLNGNLRMADGSTFGRRFGWAKNL